MEILGVIGILVGVVVGPGVGSEVCLIVVGIVKDGNRRWVGKGGGRSVWTGGGGWLAKRFI